MVRVISISDEVYFELSRIKNGMSFTELLKSLLERCESKGDPKKITEFLKTHEPISEDSAKAIAAELKKGRKRAVSRNIVIE